ncbi:hypothetical protein LX86_004970 [Lentzea aerocolonigenes]|nr:hypothetical protein [Lentzea aerocolonigenes]
MSHREEPRSGRGCFGAVVVVPFLALGGMFALIALTGSPDEAPLAAPPPARPTSQWWTEPFETGTTLSTVTETVVVEGQAREVRAARMATQTRVSTVTETVRVSSTKPAATGRNEPLPEEEPEEGPSTPDSTSVVTTSASSVPPAPPVSSAPADPSVEPPVTSTPRSEEPVSPAPSVPTTPSVPRAEEPAPPSGAVPPCERSAPGESSEASGGVSVEITVVGASPAEESSTSSAPLAGV